MENTSDNEHYGPNEKPLKTAQDAVPSVSGCGSTDLQPEEQRSQEIMEVISKRDREVKDIEVLCKILAEKEVNPIGYSIKRTGEKISEKCIICDTVVALGDYSKRIYNLKSHSSQQGHKINLLFHQSGESAVAIKLEQLLEKDYPGIFKIKNMAAICHLCKGNGIQGGKGHHNFLGNVKQHVGGKDHNRLINNKKQTVKE